MTGEFENKQRIIQEFVPGKQVTLAHVIAHPVADLYGKLGLFETEGAMRDVMSVLCDLMAFTPARITRT